MFYIAATALCVAAGLGAWGLYKDAVKASSHRRGETENTHPGSGPRSFELRDRRERTMGRPLESAPIQEPARETGLLS